MNWKRGLGIGLVLIGLFIILTGKTITGNVIGTSPQNYLGIFGIIILFIGIILFSTGTLEDRTNLAQSILETEKISTPIISLDPSETILINESKRALKEGGFEKEAELLNKKDYQSQLLSDYSAISQGSKLYETGLYQQGFRQHALKLLRDREFERFHTYPGLNKGGPYIRLNDLIDEKELTNNKIHLRVYDNQLLRDGKLVQGIKIEGDEIVFQGRQFTSREAAKLIIDDKKFERKNLEDPYVYFSEAGWFSEKSESDIRKTLGGSRAESQVRAKIRYPLEKVWIKASKGNPLHIAIDGDVVQENLIRNKGKLIDYITISQI